MKILIQLTLLFLAATCLLGVQRQTFIAQNKPVASTGSYQYIAVESGTCVAMNGCSITLNTINGDVLVTNCVVNGPGTCDNNWTDANAETWNDDFDVVGTVNASSGTTVIQNGGSGDVINCRGSIAYAIFCSITAYRSPTGWNGGGGGDPVDTGNYVLASNPGPCTVTADGATSQTNELAVGGCVTTVGTPTSFPVGYSAANNGVINTDGFGSYWNGYVSVTNRSTFSFTTNGTLTTPLSMIMTLEPL